MSLTVLVPAALRSHAGGTAEVVLPAGTGTVGNALEALFSQHPGLRDRVLDGGDLRPHVAIFLDERLLRRGDALATPVRDGATLAILPAVSGG